MSALTWIDVANAMLAGAQMLPEAEAHWWEDADGEPTEDRARVAAVCAEGCITYALGHERAQGNYDESFSRAMDKLAVRYAAQFPQSDDAHVVGDGSRLWADNDRYGRDHVLANVKDLLSAHSAEAGAA